MTDMESPSGRPKDFSWARIKRSIRGHWCDIVDQPRRIRDRVKDARRRRREEKHFGPIVEREREALRRAREEFEPLYASADDNPLVSVLIPTWNRGRTLAEHVVPSVLQQTYSNFEILIVGDCCTDDTAERLARIDDPRLRFHNLPQRGDYPDDPKHRWQVAGSVPLNKGFDLARGRWIAQLDDDERFTPDHIEALLRRARATGAEIVFGKARREQTPGQWIERWGSLSMPGRPGSRSSTICRTYVLRVLRLHEDSWRIDMAGDRHLWHRMKMCGVRDAAVDRLVLIAPLRPGVSLGGWRAEDREGGTPT